MNHGGRFALLGVLVIVIAVAAPPSSPQTRPGAAWELGEYREIRLDSRAGAELRGAATLKLDSVAVVRPQLVPGERAALVAQYSIASPTEIEVKETRIVRFSDTVLLTRESVVTRVAGQWRSEYALTVPPGAAEGLYTLTTRVELRSARGVVEEKKSVFAVSSGSTPSTVAASAPPAPARPPAAAASPPPAPARPPAVAAPPSAAPARPSAVAPQPPVAAPSPPAPTPTVSSPLPPAAASSTAGPTNGIRITLWTDKQRYRVGETVTFHFETSRDAYVTLINAGTSGAVTVLFPNRFSQGQEVKGKTVYSIPRSQDGYTMNVSGPPGIELVYALATLEPIKFIDSDFSGTRSIFRSVDGGVVTRDINAVAKQTRIDRQAKAMIELEVVK
jgi:hypothetical protein